MIQFIPLLIKLSDFIKPLFNFLGKHWKVLTIILICIGIFFYVQSLNKKIDNLQEDITELSVKYERCQNNTQTLRSSIKRQNEAIQVLKNDINEREKRVQEITEEQSKLKKQHQKQIQDLLREQQPETCEDVTEYLINGKDDLQWSN